MELNEAQRNIVLHGDNPLMVIASAGGGKSTVLKLRTGMLLKRGKRNILVTTFTRNTSKDLKKKIYSINVKDKSGRQLNVKDCVNVSTFHALCFQMMKREGYKPENLVKPYEVENIFKRILPDKEIDVNSILSFIGYQKNNMVSYDGDLIMRPDDPYDKETMRYLYQKYVEYQRSNGKYDMDDYLLFGYKILQETGNRYVFDYALIDECQDSNEIQMRLIDLICPSHRVTVFGDKSQSIYSFRGSNPELFANFYNRYDNVDVINMNVNYRSDKEIVERSNDFIRKYSGDYKYYMDAVSNSDNDGDISMFLNEGETEEAHKVCDRVQSWLGLGVIGKDIAVLYRNNIQIQSIENEFRSRGIPYHIESDASFFDRKEIAFVMNVLRLMNDKSDNTAFIKILKERTPTFQYISNKTLETINVYSKEDARDYFELASDINVEPRQKRILFNFRSEINRLIDSYNDDGNIVKTINDIIEDFQLELHLKHRYPNAEDARERLLSLNNLKKFAQGQSIGDFIEFAYSGESKKKAKPKDEEVRLMTIHKSKGLEFDNVIIAGIQTGKLPSEKSTIEEEARVFYVGVTRAKHEMILSQFGSENIFLEQYFGDMRYQRMLEEAE